jgi:integrase
MELIKKMLAGDMVALSEIITKIEGDSIQRLLGHKDPKMVQRYAHHSVDSLRIGIGVLENLDRRREEELAQI